MVERLRLGAPGIYELPDVPLRTLTGVRMDVCAFVGVAPRGAARSPASGDGEHVRRSVPVAVESWSAYQREFGGLTGPGRLPYAVASFFENGGRRAYVVRIVHDYGAGDPLNDAGVASARLTGMTRRGGGDVWLRARSEGSWGNRLRLRLSFLTRAVVFDRALATVVALVLPRGSEVGVGVLLRFVLPGGVRALRFVAAIDSDWHPDTGETITRAVLDAPLSSAPEGAELVEALAEIDDGDGRRERMDRIGLSADHPRWFARVLAAESNLVYPDERNGRDWLAADLLTAASLASVATAAFEGGEDRYVDIAPEDFFDWRWQPIDEASGDGVQSIAELRDVAMLVAPDLYSPESLKPVSFVVSPGSLAGPDFAPCVEIPSLPAEQAEPVDDLPKLLLDPEQLSDFERIVELQQALVDFAEQQRTFVVLLDVPPRLSAQRTLAWRARFDSSYAAAYTPWLKVVRQGDARNLPVQVNPSAVAAGIVAQREISLGIAYGPANVIAQGVVDLSDDVSPARHDALHGASINVYRRERDGIRLTAARTLAMHPEFRQVSVRRLMTMLRLVLERQMQWMVFEPNSKRLRSDLRHAVVAYLRQLHHANAFHAAREEEAFFVRADESVNTRQTIDGGQVVAEVGVAFAEPLEFIVLQIARDGDGTLRVGGTA